MRLSNEEIARIYHSANMAHQAVTLDDMPAQPWLYMPRSIRAVSVNAVRRVREGAVTTAEAHHEEWYAGMEALGYAWGPDKDHEKKTHPALLHWAHLPADKRQKARLFVGMVHLLDLEDD